MVAHACRPSTWETEEEESQISGAFGVHSKVLPQKKLKCLKN